MLIDVTRSLSSGHPVWPGDPPLALEQVASITAGDGVNVSRLSMSVHVGTHLDAPWHYDEAGARLHELPLDALVGPCLLLDLRGAGPVGAEALTGALRALAGVDRPPPRLLLHTGEPDRWERFPEGFRPLSVELIEALAALGVRLVGTDAPSVDAYGVTGLPVHDACARAGVLIVEGLALAGVAPGAYELTCLPLRLEGADGSPVRAVLRRP